MKKALFVALFFYASSLFSSYEQPWGQDADLSFSSTPLPKNSRLTIGEKIADSIIKFHQRVISPVSGSRSSFRPTSSRYMQLAIYRYGLLQGFMMGCDRLLRENGEPWVYQKIHINGSTYKFDPALMDKHHKY